MKKAGIAAVICIVLQIAQSELLTLGVLCIAGLWLALRVIVLAGEKGVL